MLNSTGIEVVSEEMECGDYLLAQGVAVERKAAQDFVASIFDRRLFSQILALKSAYARPFFLEGLPSLGPSAAKKLLEHFCSANTAFAADAEALRKVPGIGPKTIETMRAVLAYDVRP